jgi:capsular exopolysaccharide synthesis family protein
MEISKAITADDLALRSPARIVLLQPANIPPDSNGWIRWLGLIGAGLASFLSTVFGFAVVDYSKNIMSSPSELEKETNIPVLGKLPSVHEGIKSLLGGSGRGRGALLSDCVDSVRAALTRGDKASDIDSVIITSAVGKEGKSTVASQLAVSMAKSGKKTVLVDGDLRNPRQHVVFGIPLDRGLSDILRGEATLEEVVQATPSENLWILPAGAARPGSSQGMSGNTIGKLINQLRSQFDFVIIDIAPVLTGPDAVIFGVHVSGAVFATRQDHSSIEKVDEAQRRLRSVGIRILGAVINGAASESRGVLALPAA